MKLNKLIIKKNSIVEIINFMSSTYLFGWTLVPTFRNRFNEGVFKYFFVAVVILWFITSLLISKKWYLDLILPTLVGFLTLLFMLIYIYSRYGDMTLSRLIGPTFVFLFSYMGYYYSNVKCKKTLRSITVIIVMFSTYTATTTLSALINDPSVSRLMTSSSTSPEILSNLNDLNVAGYDFIYGIVLLIPVLLKMPSIIKKNRFLKAISYLIVLLFFILIGFANFTTAYLLTIIAIVLNQINSGKLGKKLVFLSISTILVLSGFLKKIGIWFLLLLRDISPGLRTKANLLGIVNTISGTNSLNEITTRGTLLRNSIHSFKKKPLFGVGGYYTDNNIIGMHSQFIDDYARFGLIGYTPFLIYILVVMKKVFNNFGTTNVRKIFLNSSILYFLLSFLNPIYSYNISFSYFLVLPTLSSYLDIQL